MKTSNKVNMIFRFIITFMTICCFIINTIRINHFTGAWYFALSTIVYSLGIILGAAYLIMYLFLFRKYKIKNSTAWLILVIILLPLLIYSSLNYYKDLYKGKIEFETDIYRTIVASYYEYNPGIPKTIELSSYPGYWSLIISDEMYNDLITNNPFDETREVFNANFYETIHPHLHPIIIKFYENTKIVDSIQIIYDDNTF